MSEPDNNDLDARYVSELYRKLNKEQPSPELDQRILQRARAQAVQADAPNRSHNKGPVKLAQWRRWQWPISAVATVTLATLLFLYQQPEVAQWPPVDQQYDVDPAKVIPGVENSFELSSEHSSERYSSDDAGQSVHESEALMSPEISVGSGTVQNKQQVAPMMVDQGQSGAVMSSAPKAEIPLEPLQISPERAVSTAREEKRSQSLMRQKSKSVTADSQNEALEETLDEVRREIPEDLSDELIDQQETDQRFVHPERWLIEIEKLLSTGDRAGARRLFANFREEYPDYEISDELLDELKMP